MDELPTSKSGSKDEGDDCGDVATILTAIEEMNAFNTTHKGKLQLLCLRL